MPTNKKVKWDVMGQNSNDDLKNSKDRLTHFGKHRNGEKQKQ